MPADQPSPYPLGSPVRVADDVREFVAAALAPRAGTEWNRYRPAHFDPDVLLHRLEQLLAG